MCKDIKMDVRTTSVEIAITRQVSSMIHSARPIVTLVANIVYCCFVFLDLKSLDGRTDNMCKNNHPYQS